MLLFLSILGVFLSALLLSFNPKKFEATLYLGFFFFTVSLYALSQYILLYSKSVLLVTLFLWHFSVFTSIPYLIGPMLFFYIRSLLNDTPQLKISDSLHFLPVLLVFLISIPQNWSPLSGKIADAITVINDVGYIKHFKGTPLSGIFSVEAIFLSRPGIILIYTVWSGILYARFILGRKKSGVLSRQYFMIRWLTFLLGFLFLLVVCQMVSIIRAFSMDFSEMFFTLNIFRLLSGLGLIGLLISPFFFPAILYGLPRLPDSVTNLKQRENRHKTLHEKSTENRNSFEAEYLNLLAQKIDTCMEEKQPFLQHDFNLAYLSVMIQTPVHHLAFFFREVKNEHFNDYRNRWRVQYAKNLINEGKTSDLTLEAIGLNSGFSNRNAFRNAFKKLEGCSPADLASQIEE